jgi:glycosyltransferase involved in cell wall biosynthesis
LKIAYVVQRYGPAIWGGAEAHCRDYAERLAARGLEVEVFTTCATDYRTWANELPEGESVEAGVVVRRFPVARERSADFDDLCDRVLSDPAAATADLQLHWMEQQGPDSPRLIDALREEHGRFDLVVFVTYLYFTTYFGLPVAHERSVLHPTAHDEAPIRLSIFDDMFRLPRAFVFLTPEERRFVHRRFELGDVPQLVSGVGVEVPEMVDGERGRKRLGAAGRYVLYLGRIDRSKGIDHMCAFYDAYRRRTGTDVELVLVGDPVAAVPDTDGIRVVGPVDDHEKWDALAGAEALIQPSFHESFAINLLEAWSVGTPAIVNGATDVMTGHCRRSGGGVWYQSYAEFEACMDRLLGDPPLAGALGRRGAAYVKTRYAWDRLIDRYVDFLAVVRASI